jgi:DNA-binding transcriptional LysR family regulator
MSRKLDVPIDLLRSLVASVEAGSVAKAAQQLNLPPSEIEAHLGELRNIVGFELFSKSGPRLRLTKDGFAILSYARRITSMNDELMRVTTEARSGDQFRIGLPAWMPHRRLVEVIKSCSDAYAAGVVAFRCDELETIMGDLRRGQLDLAFLCNVAEAPGVAVAEWTEPLYWVKAPDLKLRPGEPVRLVSWSGGMSDRVGPKLLEEAGIGYSMVFSSPSIGARLAAVAAGLGLMLCNERVVIPEVRLALEPHLPTPPQIRTGIYMREGLDGGRHSAVVRAFEATMAPRGFAQTVVSIEPRAQRRRGSGVAPSGA